MRDASELRKALGRGPGEEGRQVTVAAAELVGVLSALKGMGDFILMDIDAVDRPEGFDLAYRLLDRGERGPWECSR